MRLLLSHVSVLVVLTALLPVPATADFAEDRKLCRISSSEGKRIAACTRQIDSGKWNGRDLAIAYAERGSAYNRRREYDRAIADATEAIRLDPQLTQAYGVRAMAYIGKGDRARAGPDMVRFLKEPRRILRYRQNSGDTNR